MARNLAAVAVDAQIGERIRAARAAAGLTQLEVSEAVGVGPITILNFEKGRNRIPASLLQQLADLFAVPVERFFSQPEPARFEADSDAMERACAAFDARHPVGSKVRVWASLDGERAAVPVEVIGPAHVVDGHTAAVRVAGTIALAHVVQEVR